MLPLGLGVSHLHVGIDVEPFDQFPRVGARSRHAPIKWLGQRIADGLEKLHRAGRSVRHGGLPGYDRPRGPESILLAVHRRA